MESSALAESVSFTGEMLQVHLTDGRVIGVPLSWLPRLLHATEAERNQVEIRAGGRDLRWVALEGNLSVAGLLAGAGPEIRGQTSECTPLMRAALSEDGLLLRDLIAAGADVTTSDFEGRTALHYAVGRPHNIEALLVAGAAPDAKDIDGDTPLWYGILNGDEASCKALLTGGAEVPPNFWTRAWLPSTSVVALLRRFGLDLDEPNPDGLTPLERAVEDGNLELVDWLLRHVAGTTEVPRVVERAKQLARDKGDPERSAIAGILLLWYRPQTDRAALLASLRESRDSP